MSAEQLTATRTAVEDFRANAGPRAQAALISDDDHHPHTSYISEMWYDMYLRDRSPLPINITPQVTWRMDDNPAKNEQAVRAADICHAAARYYAALKSNVLLPDAFHTKAHITKNPAFEQMVKLLPSSLSYYPAVAAGAYALDMSQYARLFCSTRVPHRSKDELRSAEHCNFAIAIRGSDLFKVRLFEGADGDVDGQHLKVFSPSQIEAQIRAVLAAKPSGLPRVAALTEMNRDEWADAREHMETSPMNRASLADVDRALFVISLDDSTPETHEELSRAMLHGGERDRWFDKCFNIAVCKNGEPPAPAARWPARRTLPSPRPPARRTLPSPRRQLVWGTARGVRRRVRLPSAAAPVGACVLLRRDQLVPPPPRRPPPLVASQAVRASPGSTLGETAWPCLTSLTRCTRPSRTCLRASTPPLPPCPRPSAWASTSMTRPRRRSPAPWSTPSARSRRWTST